MISPFNFFASFTAVELLPTPVGPNRIIRFLALDSNFYQQEKHKESYKDQKSENLFSLQFNFLLFLSF
jgi:hypothetical protein